MAGLREIFEKALETGKVEYSYFGGNINQTPFTQYSIPYPQNSKQPYIRLGIDPEVQFRANSSFDDVYNTGLAITRDTERLTKWGLDGTQGVLYTLKQQSLHLSNPDTSYKAAEGTEFTLLQAARNLITDGPRVYNPLSVIENTIGAPVGIHFLKHLNLSTDPANPAGYLSENIGEGDFYPVFKSRLAIYKEKLVTEGNQTAPILLNSSLGGPNSTFGIGRTTTYTYKDTLGLNTGKTDKDFGSIYDEALASYNGFTPWSYSNIYNYGEDYENGNLAYKGDGDANKKIQDFRQEKDFTKSQDYPTYNIHNRIGVTTGQNAVGAPNTVDSINILKITPSTTFYGKSVGNNQVEGTDLYVKGYDTASVFDQVKGFYGRDIIKFRIEVLNNNNPVENGQINTDVLAFRAYLDNVSDNFSATWKDFNYMGRGEPFYVYEKFNRDVQVNFTIFAHSAQEMASIYTKVDYLMSMMTPDYNIYNQMRGNYVYLTIGDYIYRQPGVITTLNFSDIVGQNQTGWEIALNEPDSNSPNNTEDKKHYEVPKMLKVQMAFKPIHNFLPKRMYASDPNFSATFVTPNHKLLKTPNRYLPSVI